jgi:hypothetical protein
MYMYGGVARQIPPPRFDQTCVRLVTLRGYVVTLRVTANRDPSTPLRGQSYRRVTYR